MPETETLPVNPTIRSQSVYFTAADINIIPRSHPDPQWKDKPIDAVGFVLSHGRNPIHIWNYTRRGNENEEIAALSEGQQGGALFDDTALSNSSTTIQIVLNELKFRTTKYILPPHSYIGDIDIIFEAAYGWETEIQKTGYRLIAGYVQNSGKEITVENATYPTITIQFKDLKPLSRKDEISQAREGRQSAEEPQLNDIPEQPPTEAAPTAATRTRRTLRAENSDTDPALSEAESEAAASRQASETPAVVQRGRTPRPAQPAIAPTPTIPPVVDVPATTPAESSSTTSGNSSSSTSTSTTAAPATAELPFLRTFNVFAFNVSVNINDRSYNRPRSVMFDPTIIRSRVDSAPQIVAFTSPFPVYFARGARAPTAYRGVSYRTALTSPDFGEAYVHFLRTQLRRYRGAFVIFQHSAQHAIVHAWSLRQNRYRRVPGVYIPTNPISNMPERLAGHLPFIERAVQTINS